MCLDQYKFLVTRICTESGWIPSEPPDCEFTQISYEHANKCPMDYEQVITSKSKSLCLLLTDPQPWNNTCLSAGSSDTIFDLDANEHDSLVQQLIENDVHQFWMPAKQIYEYSPIVWQLPGKKFGEIIELDRLSIYVNYTGNNSSARNDCFSVSRINSDKFVASLESCDRNLTILCVFKMKEPLLKLACPKDFYTTRYARDQNVCYSTHMIMNMTRAAQYSRAAATRNQSSMNWVSSECRGELYTMTSIEQTVIYKELGSFSNLDQRDRCLFGISRNTYISSEDQWKTVSPSVNFVNWAIPGARGSVVTADRSGSWHWTSNTFTCIACLRRLEMRLPKMSLHFEDAIDKLYLIVYDERFLWRDNNDGYGIKCFTNADYELIKRVKIEEPIWTGTLVIDGDGEEQTNELSKLIFELKTQNDGPGYYWCEAFAIPNFQFIHTERVVAYKRFSDGHVFAIKVETDCYGMCLEHFHETYMKVRAKQFQRFLRESRHRQNRRINIDNVRVMQIESIDNDFEIMEILFHVTVSLDERDYPKCDECDNLHIYFTDDMIKVYHIKNMLTNVLSREPSTEYRFISLNSTEYCLPVIERNSKLRWTGAIIGETVAPIELCMHINGMPILRKCVGDFIYGGMWKNLTQQKCYYAWTSDITKNLYDIDQEFMVANETSTVIYNIKDLVANYSALVPADLYYLSNIMKRITLFNNDSTLLNRNEFNNIFTIYNSLMFVNENITKTSAALNTTNILLDAFDNIINHLSVANLTLNTIKLSENVDDGTIAVITPKLVIYVIDPMIKNISGISLYKNITQNVLPGQEWYGDTDDFFDYTIRTLYTNQSSVELLHEDLLEVATFVPATLLARLNETKVLNETDMPLRIVITIYYNDNLFQEFKNITHAKPGGKIISVSIPGYGPNLPVLLPILIRTSANASQQARRDACGYWKLKQDEGWCRDGCDYSGYSESVVLCACSHLTHFAYLVLGTFVHSISTEDDVIITQIHQSALDMITLLGCSLSLLGIFGIYVTAIIFPFWREKPSSKVLLQLSTAIGIQMILLCFVNTEASSYKLLESKNLWGCVALGAALHYSVLVAFSWMLITAYLQFMRYVRVLGQTRCTRFFLKSFLFGWILPILPVMIVVCGYPDSYIPDLDEYSNAICYPSGMALYLGVILPIGMIISANLVIFVIVLWNVLRSTDAGNMRTSERDLTLSQLRLSILLFFLLGLTWFLGFLASTRAGLVFSYLFCLIATLQGFVLFLYFIILDPVTRNLWNRFIQRHLCCTAEKTNFGSGKVMG